MKKIKQLDDFNEDVNEGVSAIKQRGKVPEKAKFRFEVSDNMKKAAKIEKTLIDVNQLLTEMSDEIVALKMNFPNMDPESMKLMNNMAYNLLNMIHAISNVDKRGSKTGMIDNIGRLQRNMRKLKKEFVNK